MDNFDNILKEFLNLLQSNDSFEYIQATYLGGSYITQNNDNHSDLDIIIICKEAFTEDVYNKIRKSIKENKITKYLDVKIIGEEDAKHIINSVDMPFFHHFFLNSKLIYGIDLFQNYKINQIWFYHSIQDILNKVENIKDLAFIYKQRSEAELMLYNSNKKLAIIYELLAKGDNDFPSYKLLLLKRYENVYLDYIRDRIKKNRDFVSRYKNEGSKGAGFKKIKIHKSKIQNNDQTSQEFIEDEIKQTIQFAKRCLDLLDY